MNNIEILYGEEEYLIDTHIEELKRGLNSIELNYMMYKEDSTDLIEILDMSRQSPFMDKYRVTVYDCEDFFKILSNLSEKELEIFEEYLENPSETTMLIFKARKIDKRSKFYKKLNSKIKLINYEPLDKIKFNNYLDKKFQEHNLKINKAAKEYFIEKTRYLEKECKINLYNINNQITKLSSLNKKVIDINSVDMLVDQIYENNLFKLIDLIFDKKFKQSINLLNSLLNNQTSTVLILSQILRQISILIKVSTLKNNTNESLDLPPFVIKKAKKQLNLFSTNELLKLFNTALDLDYMIKTGKINDIIGIELIISKIVYTKMINYNL